MSDSSHDLELLLKADSAVSRPTELDRARNRRALARRLAIGGLGASQLGAGHALAKLVTSAGASKWFGALGLLSLCGGAAWWLHDSMPEKSQPPSAPAFTSSSISPSVPAPHSRELGVNPLAASVAAPGGLDREREPESTRTQPAAPPLEAPDEDTLGAETRLLSRVRGALRSGDSTTALELLDQHGREFPRGALVQEAQATRVFALCQSGQNAAGRAAAQRFLRRFPGSPLSERVGRACGNAQAP